MVGVIYDLVYKGGDTLNYFSGARASFAAFSEGDFEAFWYFISYSTDDDNIKYEYWRKYHSLYYYSTNESAWFIVRIASILNILALNSYFSLSIFLSVFSFSGCWVLYKTFSKYYPEAKKQLGWIIFYLPSLWFWGSGLLKDSICLGALGWLTYLMYEIVKEKRTRLIVFVFPVAFLVFKIKSYILFAFIPFSAVWLMTDWVNTIKNNILRKLFFPFFLGGGAILGLSVMSTLSAGSKFDMEHLLDHAAAHSNDLKQSYYYSDGQGSSFDIGTIDGTIGSLISKIPIAVFTGLFRPSLLDTRNPLMLLSALESTLMMFSFLYLLFSIGFFKFFTGLLKKPIIIFCVAFSLLLAFFVAISTSNFGSLVRYRIPCIPFFLSAMYMIYYESKHGTIFSKNSPEVENKNQTSSKTKINILPKKKRSLRSHYR